MRTLCAVVLMVAAPVVAAAQAGPSAEETAILQADRAFDQAVADRNVERFLALIDETATFEGGGMPLHGRDAIRAGWTRYFEPDGPTLRWTPHTAHVLAAGRDVGVTTGSWVLTSRGPDGARTESRGEYLTVWRKGADGTWRVVFDTGSQEPARGGGDE
jgi:uncharacterized protein (TIGR02246 family)